MRRVSQLANSQDIQVKWVSDEKFLFLSFCSLLSCHVASGLKEKSGVPKSSWWKGVQSGDKLLDREVKVIGFCVLGI